MGGAPSLVGHRSFLQGKPLPGERPQEEKEVAINAEIIEEDHAVHVQDVAGKNQEGQADQITEERKEDEDQILRLEVFEEVEPTRHQALEIGAFPGQNELAVHDHERAREKDSQVNQVQVSLQTVRLQPFQDRGLDTLHLVLFHRSARSQTQPLVTLIRQDGRIGDEAHQWNRKGKCQSGPRPPIPAEEFDLEDRQVEQFPASAGQEGLPPAPGQTARRGSFQVQVGGDQPVSHSVQRRQHQ